MEGIKIKADQLRATGADVVIAPCHNCHRGLEDVNEHYKLGMEFKFLSEIIYDCMEKTNTAG
jgi:Fe-S oxidoreductase